MCSFSFAGLSSFSLSSHERHLWRRFVNQPLCTGGGGHTHLVGSLSGRDGGEATSAPLCQQGGNKWLAREAVRGITPAAARSSAYKINPHPLYEHALKVRLRALIDDILLVDRSLARGTFSWMSVRLTPTTARIVKGRRSPSSAPDARPLASSLRRRSILSIHRRGLP